MIDYNGNEKVISGDDAFKHDNTAFQLTTQLIARENNIEVDEDGFHLQMSMKKEKLENQSKFKGIKY